MDESEDWECDEHTWVSAGVTISNGCMTRVWTCANCPGWTQEMWGRKYEINFPETSMFEGSENRNGTEDT